MMSLRNSDILLIISLMLSAMPSVAQNLNREAKELYYQAKDLAEIDSYGHSQEKHELGISKLEEAIRLEPTYYDAYVSLSKAYWDYGIVYIGSKAENIEKRDLYIKKARHIAKKAMELAPNRPSAYLQYWNTIETGTKGG